MEKAVLQTLIYADIFDFPLNIFEIHKWLIGYKCNLRQIEKVLARLSIKYKVSSIKGYYCLSKRKGLVKKRLENEKYSKFYFRKAFLISFILKLIPWVKLVGISGGLAMDNTGKEDDIDLFVITSKGRMWISRLLILGILSLIGQRRSVSDSKKSAAGKICCNLILEEDFLEQKKKNIFTAHEVLQMKVLWQRGEVYHKFLSDNDWVFKFLPNWVDGQKESVRQGAKNRSRDQVARLKFVSRRPTARETAQHFLIAPDFTTSLESWAKKWQLKIMQIPSGQERIEDGALYFHPIDYGEKVLKEYKSSLQKILT